MRYKIEGTDRKTHPKRRDDHGQQQVHDVPPEGLGLGAESLCGSERQWKGIIAVTTKRWERKGTETKAARQGKIRSKPPPRKLPNIQGTPGTYAPKRNNRK
jgi:hypothetical protein